MEIYLIIAICFYFGSVLFLPIILWNSKKNIAFFQGIPFNIIAYFGGCIYFIDFAKENYNVKDEILEFYAVILLISTVVYIVFFVWGFFSKGYIFKKIKDLYLFFDTDNINKICSTGFFIGIITVLLFVVSFYGIGFIPIFADNPFAAKYMSGEYQEAYRSFAIPYRLALNLSNIAIILLIIDFFRKKRMMNIILILSILVCLIFTMRRGMIVNGLVLLIFSYMAYQSKWKFSITVVIYMVVLILGSASNDIFLYSIGLKNDLDLTSIFRGAPDLADQLYFLQHWIGDYWDNTWGLNYVGALIPYHSEYNLAVITLNVIGATAGEVASGGFRLPIPIISYIAYGWIGVIIIPALASYISGAILCLKREMLENTGLIKFIILNALLFSNIVGILNVIFVGITLDNITLFIVVAIIFINAKYKIKI